MDQKTPASRVPCSLGTLQLRLLACTVGQLRDWLTGPMEPHIMDGDGLVIPIMRS